ncbi:MAG: helix-turn-helix transcriptional regulator [Archangiaceae bacterium]|nr:helix-turn-helix transcriptional regulator [Archangiaceae bacterium]
MAFSLRREFSCPVELALEVLGGKWKVVLLAHLKERPRRYAELRRLVPRLSDKMLAQRLRDLEELGLVRHRKQRGFSEYALTARGLTLGPALTALYDWGTALAPEVGASLSQPS